METINYAINPWKILEPYHINDTANAWGSDKCNEDYQVWIEKEINNISS